jgi:hypothetical protein
MRFQTQLTTGCCRCAADAAACPAGTAQHAAAVRQLSEAVATPAEQGKQIIPFKDAEGTWHPSNVTGLDFESLTLLDLPSPEVFLEVAMTSPYPMPDIPMQTLVDNTVKAWAGGKPPSNVNDW